MIISGHMWIFISLLTGCSLNLSELSKLKLLCCSGQRRTGWAMAIEWRLTGSYFETCNCEAACPCNFLGPPTDGHCTVLVPEAPLPKSNKILHWDQKQGVRIREN